jgi:hypothetical protein
MVMMMLDDAAEIAVVIPVFFKDKNFLRNRRLSGASQFVLSNSFFKIFSRHERTKFIAANDNRATPESS